MLNKFLKLFIQTLWVYLFLALTFVSLFNAETFAQDTAVKKVVKGFPVSFDIKLSGHEDISEGEIRSVVVDIRNNSERILVLENLVASCGAESGEEDFLYPISGLLDYDAVSDSYYYNSLVQAETPPVFVKGLLLPKQSVQSVIPLKVLDNRVKLVLRLYSFSLDDLVEALYFPAETIELVETKFSHLSYTKVKQIFDEEAYKFIQYIFRPASKFKSKFMREESELSVNLKKFAYRDALRRIQARESDKYTYFNLAGGWVIEKRGRPFLVKKDQILPYPIMDFRVLKYVDEIVDPKSAITITVNEASYAVLSGYYQMKAISKVKYFEDVPYILYLPKNNFLDFLKICYGNNLKLDFTFYTAGKWRIDVK